jgi:hypothetical protein
MFSFEKHNVPEIGFCIRAQVEPTQLGLIDRASTDVGRKSLDPTE